MTVAAACSYASENMDRAHSHEKRKPKITTAKNNAQKCMRHGDLQWDFLMHGVSTFLYPTQEAPPVGCINVQPRPVESRLQF